MIDLDKIEARAREQVRELGTTVAVMPGELLELIRLAREGQQKPTTAEDQP